jgi:hypothetical protein
MIRYSAVSLDSGLWAERSDIRFLAGERDVSSSKQIHTDSEAHPASYSMETKGCPPGVERPRHNLSPANSEATNKWIYTSTPLIRIIDVDKDEFTFTFKLA